LETSKKRLRDNKSWYRQDERELKIGALIIIIERKNLISLLREYVDVFAWSYIDMPSLHTNIVVYKVPLNEESIHVKQKL